MPAPSGSMTFAGVSFAQPTPDLMVKVERWWDENAPELWRHPGYALERVHHLPVPDRPNRREQARLNVLYWPTGASRWGVFHGLMTGDQVAAVQDVVGTVSPVASTFSLATTVLRSVSGIVTAVSQEVTVGMRLLSARPLFTFGQSSARTLYLVTLVDTRYYWWTRELDYTVGTTWADLLTDLAEAASGVTPTVPSVEAAYGTPNPLRWTAPSRPLPPLIDAAAASVGLRFVVRRDGTTRYVTSTTAAAESLAQSVTGSSDVVLGGRLTALGVSGNVPESVVTTFWGDVPSAETVTLASLSLPAYGSLTGVVGSRAFVGVDQRSGVASPAPATVAARVATDYYGWALSLTDATYRGMQEFESTGIEDRVEWEYVPGLQPRIEEGDPRLRNSSDARLPDERVITRVVPTDLHDRNLYGDRPPPGYTYVVVLDEKQSGEDRWKATIRVTDEDDVIDGPQLGWDDDAFVLFDQTATASVGDYGTAVPDPLTPSRWLFVPSGAGNNSKYIKLTSSGVGIDGGTAWKGLIQVEQSGAVVDGDPLNADEFVLYATRAANGLVGNPEVDDIVHASPDPERAGVWLFQPKLYSESRDCFSCGWVKFLKKGATACLEAKNLGGYGACSCVLAEDVYYPMPVDDDLDVWARTVMMTTCCGCGLFIVDVDDEGNITAQIKGVHVTCDGTGSGQENSATVDVDLTVDCCGMEYDEETEEVKPYFIVSGWSVKACSETGEGCIHYFRVKVRCDGVCPTPVCAGCCDENGAPATYKFGPLAGFDVATNNGLNGWWTLPHAGSLNGSPYWEGECDYSGEGGTVSRLYYEPDGDKYVLNHGGAIYEKDAADWDCGISNELSWVSGTDPGAQETITVFPLGVYPSNDCVFPETMYVSTDNPSCPQIGAITNFPVNRIGSTTAWQGSSGTRTVDVECFGGIFVMNVTDQCPVTLEPVSAASVGRPTRTHNPFEIVWDEVVFTTVAGGVEDCCDEESIGSATATAA